MAFGHTEHSESLLYPSELLSLQVLGLSLFDLTAWANNCVCVWCVFFPLLLSHSFPQEDKKHRKMKSAMGHFLKRTKMGINGRSTG